MGEESTIEKLFKNMDKVTNSEMKSQKLFPEWGWNCVAGRIPTDVQQPFNRGGELVTSDIGDTNRH